MIYSNKKVNILMFTFKELQRYESIIIYMPK